MSVSAGGIVGLLRRHGLRVFRTPDLATLAAMSAASAAHALQRLQEDGVVLRLKRGLWVNRLAPDFNPCEAVPFLRASWPAYVSLYSALADYGVVEELPQTIYAVTPANPCRVATPVGRFSFHHLPSRLFWGFETRTEAKAVFPIAEREKAFLDQVYLALVPRSSIEFPVKRGRSWELDRRKLGEYAKRFAFPPLAAWLKKNRLV